VSTRKVEFVYPAPEDERYAPGAFDGRIGQPITMTRQVSTNYSVVLTEGVLREAEVIQDGHAVRVVVELPDTVATRTLPF
jgi:hypothetical protein